MSSYQVSSANFYFCFLQNRGINAKVIIWNDLRETNEFNSIFILPKLFRKFFTFFFILHFCIFSVGTQIECRKGNILLGKQIMFIIGRFDWLHFLQVLKIRVYPIKNLFNGNNIESCISTNAWKQILQVQNLERKLLRLLINELIGICEKLLFFKQLKNYRVVLDSE